MDGTRMCPPLNVAHAQGAGADAHVFEDTTRVFAHSRRAERIFAAEAHVANNIVGKHLRKLRSEVRPSGWLPLRASWSNQFKARPARGVTRWTFREGALGAGTGWRGARLPKQIDDELESSLSHCEAAITYAGFTKNACLHAHGGRGQNYEEMNSRS